MLQWLANNDHFVEASGLFFGHVPGANNGKLTRFFVLASQARHQVYYPRQVREDVDDI